MTGKYVAAIGNLTADEYYECLQEIVVGDKFFVRYLQTLPGGMVANAASVLSALGTPTYMMSALGKDVHTELLFQSFAPYGVDTTYLDILPQYGNFKTNILISPGGRDKTIVLFENFQKPIVVIDEAKIRCLENAAYVYALMSDLKTLPNYKSLLRKLKGKGVRFMFDAECSTFTARDCPEDAFFFQLADILSFNEASAAQYCGSLGDSAFQELIGDTGKIVVVTLGKDGCRVLWRDGDLAVPAYDLKPVDTTGAGDTFNAAFLHAVLAGRSMQDCAEFATAAANRAVLLMGARAGAVPEPDVAAFAQQYRNHL